jgi:hypothetical protein
MKEMFHFKYYVLKAADNGTIHDFYIPGLCLLYSFQERAHCFGKYLPAKPFILLEYETVDKEQKTRTLPEIIDLGSLKITEKRNNRN